MRFAVAEDQLNSVRVDELEIGDKHLEQHVGPAVLA